MYDLEFLLPAFECRVKESRREDVCRYQSTVEGRCVIEELIGSSEVGGIQVAAKEVGGGDSGMGERPEFLCYAAA
jgi:hypothetical protein